MANIETLPAELEPPDRVLADNGYASGDEVAELEARVIEVLVAPGKEGRQRPYDLRPPPVGPPPKEPKTAWLQEMKQKLEQPENRALYRLRQQTVEPVFGIVKEVLGFRRFLLRGVDKVHLEWQLAPLAP